MTASGALDLTFASPVGGPVSSECQIRSTRAPHNHANFGIGTLAIVLRLSRRPRRWRRWRRAPASDPSRLAANKKPREDTPRGEWQVELRS